MPGSSRRAKGEGTLDKLPSGLWSCYTRIGKKKIRGEAAPTRAEATANHRKRVEELAAASDPASQSFTKWATNWLEGRRKSLSPTTYQTYTIWIGCISADPLGAMPIGKVSATDIRSWFDHSDLSDTSKRKRLGFIHQMLRTAGNHARYKPTALQRHRRRPLTPEEAAKLMAKVAEIDDPKLRLGVLLCLELGLRRAEACGLRHEDREGDGIRIRQTVVRVTGEIRVKRKAKSSASHSWIPLPPSLLDAIGSGKGFVLGTKDKPLYPDVLTNAIKRVTAAAGIHGIPFMGPHALRRTYGMTLLEAGVDIVTAAELMRHDPMMLAKEYAQTRQDLKRDAVKRAFPAVKPHHTPHEAQG
jgi:integrase